MDLLSIADIRAAQKRIEPHVKKTPVLSSAKLNEALGHGIYFKAECVQKVGAFKARGAMNTLLWLSENGGLPKKVVTYSSGNHAQAVSWAATTLGVEAEIFMPKSVSAVKLQATKDYGAKVTLCESRQQAETMAEAEVSNGASLIPPFDHDQVICGQGTLTLEALEQVEEPIDAIFAPCGGGGLLSGTLVAGKGINPSIKICGAEPEKANDAARSLKTGTLFRWDDSPPTIADGARTLSLSKRTLSYLKRLDHFYEISEKEIIYWTQWMCHLLKHHCEPTSALGMAAAQKWLKDQEGRKNILVLISGGNMDRETITQVWQDNHLCDLPSL